MKSINELLKKYVAEIAIGLALIGMISHVLLLLLQINKKYNLFTVFILQDPISVLFPEYGLQHNSILTLLFLIMLGTGGLHYKKSKGKDSRLLKFGYSVLAVWSIFKILATIIIFIINMNSGLNRQSSAELPSIVFDLISPLFVTSILLYVGFYLTRLMVSKQKLDYKREVLADGTMNFKFKHIPKEIRFTHLVFDMFLMISIIPIKLGVIWYGLANTVQSANSYIFASLAVSLMIITYYLLFEGLFLATPVKFLSGTTLVDRKTMKKPKMSKIFGRSISRRIPFESFSFFTKHGWHDSLTGTILVYVKKENWINFKQVIWIVAFVGIYAGTNIYMCIQKNIEENRRLSYEKTVRGYQNKSLQENVGPGDLLILNKVESKRIDSTCVIVISRATINEVVGMQYLVDRSYKVNKSTFLKKGITNSWKQKKEISIYRPLVTEAIKKYSKKKQLNLGGTIYRLKSFEEMQSPIFTSSGFRIELIDGIKNFTHYVVHDLATVEIVGIEVIEGKINWSSELPITSNFNPTTKRRSFELIAIERSEKPSKSRMRIRCNEKEFDYIIFKNDGRIDIIKELD